MPKMIESEAEVSYDKPALTFYFNINHWVIIYTIFFYSPEFFDLNLKYGSLFSFTDNLILSL
jgi:hypothetical protein